MYIAGNIYPYISRFALNGLTGIYRQKVVRNRGIDIAIASPGAITMVRHDSIKVRSNRLERKQLILSFINKFAERSFPN